MAHLDHEISLWQKNYLVAGIDEVGRGAFAGPLVAAGVILKPIKSTQHKKIKTLLSLGINDSKLIPERRRKELIKITQEYIFFSKIQYISVDIINEIGIGKANKIAFSQLANHITTTLTNHNIFFLTDAFQIENVSPAIQKNITSGDTISLSIALASILAKVERDSYMEKLSEAFPQYGFEKHKGYGTRFHRQNLQDHGSCIHHRTQFIARYV